MAVSDSWITVRLTVLHPREIFGDLGGLWVFCAAGAREQRERLSSFVWLFVRSIVRSIGQLPGRFEIGYNNIHIIYTWA